MSCHHPAECLCKFGYSNGLLDSMNPPCTILQLAILFFQLPRWYPDVLVAHSFHFSMSVLMLAFKWDRNHSKSLASKSLNYLFHWMNTASIFLLYISYVHQTSSLHKTRTAHESCWLGLCLFWSALCVFFLFPESVQSIVSRGVQET